MQHHSIQTPNASRLPILAIHSAMTIIAQEFERYTNYTVLPLEHHNTADFRTDLIGDVNIVDANNDLFEGYEIKHNIPISSSLIQTSLDKFRGTQVQRFYILTTYHHDSYAEFEPDIQRIAQAQGTQLIVNGVYPTLRYYLRLIKSTDEFVSGYVSRLQTDPSVTYQMKEAWNEIIAA